jgi:hypothetical protein
MTESERAIFAFIELNRHVAGGTIRDHFPQWDTADILTKLESAGLVSREMRLTGHGEMAFYSTKKMPVG